MDEYLCVTLLSRSGENEADFKARLSLFWTHMLRNRESDFEKVYAETVLFERSGGLLTRKYLVEADVAPTLEKELSQAGIDFTPVNPDDVYSKYEATPPEWMWIEH